MGTYISQSTVESRWGTVNIAAWSDLTGGKTADTSRIAVAITWAETYVSNRFRRSRYAVPFGTASGGGYDATLTDWMAIFAGLWLYNSRRVRVKESSDKSVMQAADQAREEMDEVLRGAWTIDATTRSTDETTAMQAVY